MNFYTSAKRAFLFISLCCLTAPAIAGCSDDEILEYARVDEVLEEYQDAFDEGKLAFKKFNETNAQEDIVKYCQIQRKNIQQTQEWLSIDAQLEKACPIFWSKSKGGVEGRAMFNTNLPIHQREANVCEANGV